MCASANKHARRPKTNPTARTRRGHVIIMMALLIITLMAMLAFAVDIGYIVTLQAQLDRAVDAGALAGAGTLAEGQVEAEQNVYTFVGMNPVGGVSLPAEQVQIEVGNWNPAAKSFGPTAEAPSALRVRAFRTGVPFFFARALGHEYFDVSSEAIAMYQPRDIVVVLDYSASMSDDSELRHISTIGQPAVEANLLQIYEELGSPTFGNMQWQPVYISSNYTSTVKTTLGLNSVPYPYPSGSWNDYINYVKSSSSTYIVDAGYYKRYGYLTLVNYWLEKKPMASETPVLWMTSEQPITAVKEAVTVFLAYLQEVETDDRVGLAVYTAADGTSVLETGLTQDLPFIEDISRHRQAGHYDRYTNIGAGIQKARIELEQNARPGAFKMIVLMTDGIANRPTDEATGRAYALEEAELCAAAKYPIVTISLGAEADTDLMQQIADLTGGVHFNIPGGQSVELYEEQLKDVFRQIAANRPLKLVK